MDETKGTVANPNLIRLSIGLEDSDDLLNDILTALEKVNKNNLIMFKFI